jgi:hypothetical protein
VKSLENETREFLLKYSVMFIDNSRSFDRLDFSFYSDPIHTNFQVETKEKRQHIDLENWPPVGIPEKHLFILDDLSARKLLKASPYSGIIVRDNLLHRYYFFDVVKLLLMPRVRVNRSLDGKEKLKGKWLIDLRNGIESGDLYGIFKSIREYIDSIDVIFSSPECFGDFVGEEISKGGIPRGAGYRNHDFEETR